MSRSNSTVETLSTTHPDATPAGPHLIIEQTDWCPGQHPDPSKRHPNQTEYLENYVQCVRCGVEVLTSDQLPSECEVSQ